MNLWQWSIFITFWFWELLLLEFLPFRKFSRKKNLRKSLAKIGVSHYLCMYGSERMIFRKQSLERNLKWSMRWFLLLDFWSDISDLFFRQSGLHIRQVKECILSARVSTLLVIWCVEFLKNCFGRECRKDSALSSHFVSRIGFQHCLRRLVVWTTLVYVWVSARFLGTSESEIWI